MGKVMRQAKLVELGIDAQYHSMGWAPWRLIPTLPVDVLEKLTFCRLNIPESYRNLELEYTPFHRITISDAYLKKIDKLYSGNQTSDDLELFMANMRDAFWHVYATTQSNRDGADEAIIAFDKLTTLMKRDRESFPKRPADELFFYSGLILWEQMVRKHSFIKKLDERKERKDDTRREHNSPVFHYITRELVNLVRHRRVFRFDIDIFRYIANYYAIFKVPRPDCDDHDNIIEIIKNSYYGNRDKQEKLLALINTIVF
jgi:hypothetical protein